MRRAGKLLGKPWVTPDYIAYLLVQGRASEAEGLLREAMAEPGSPDPTRPFPEWLRWRQSGPVDVLVAQGRLGEARRLEAERIRRLAQLGKPAPQLEVAVRRLFGVAMRSPGAVLSAAGKPEELVTAAEPGLALKAIHDVALAGDVPAAARLAAAMRTRLGTRWGPDATESTYEPRGFHEVLDALASLGDGASDAAEQRLRAIPETPSLDSRFAAQFLLGEIARSRGDCGSAIEALERARATPWIIVHFTRSRSRIWGEPGLVHSLAICHERVGDLAKARELNEELLRRWARADPDFPLLVEARAMKARLDAR
jgi:hypothetical protein